MDYKKIEGILVLINTYLIPLAEQGVKQTKNVEDDLAVSFFGGGIPAVIKKLQELEQAQTQTK